MAVGQLMKSRKVVVLPKRVEQNVTKFKNWAERTRQRPLENAFPPCEITIAISLLTPVGMGEPLAFPTI